MAENSHSFGAYYKRATSPLAVLRLLKERPMYGYEISQAMKKKSGAGLPLPCSIRCCTGWRSRAMWWWPARRSSVTVPGAIMPSRMRGRNICPAP